jgi:hypothetical protein
MIDFNKKIQELTIAVNNYYKPTCLKEGKLLIDVENFMRPYYYENDGFNKYYNKTFLHESDKSFMECNLEDIENICKFPLQSNINNNKLKKIKYVFIIIPNNNTDKIRADSPFVQKGEAFYMNSVDFSIFEASDEGIKQYYCFYRNNPYASDQKSLFLLKSKNNDWKNDMFFAKDFYDYCNKKGFDFSLEDIINDIDSCIKHINLIEY